MTILLVIAGFAVVVTGLCLWSIAIDRAADVQRDLDNKQP